MSHLKISEDEFLGKQELNRWKRFVAEDGYEMDLIHGVEKFGFIRNESLDPDNNWLKAEIGDRPNTIIVKPGFAMDKFHNRITLLENRYFTLPDDPNSWRWLRIQHMHKNTEEGKITIGGTNGSLMTGVGTKFTEVLRGQPNFPSKIAFPNSSQYNLEYEVLEVIDDENCLIQGVFDNLETNKDYTVIGTFTAGHYPTLSDKHIFQYDSISYSIATEENGQTPSFRDGEDFFICRVRNNGGVIEIHDKRYLQQFTPRTEYLMNKIDRKPNPLMALEYIKKFDFNNDVFYTIGFDWKFNIENLNLNFTTNTVNITAGSGGKYKSISDFNDGDFDGWRYYYENGEYSNILKSIKNTDNISLILDDLKIISGGVSICPDADEVVVTMGYDIYANSIRPYSKECFTFPINVRDQTITVYESQLCRVNQYCDMKYYYKSGKACSEIYDFNENTYYIEKAFSDIGDLVDTGKTITNSDLFFNGGVSPGIVDNWKQFYPNEFVLMYGNNQRVIDANTVASKLYYKFFGSNTVKIQGKVNFGIVDDATVNGGLGPNGIMFTTPFTWFDDQVGNRFIRSFTGNLKYKEPVTLKTKFEQTRCELFYTPSFTVDGEDSPSNKICMRYLKGGVGELSDPDDITDVVTYPNPLPANTQLEFDVDMMVYFDFYNKAYVNGPIGQDNTNPNVATGGLPDITNYSMLCSVIAGNRSFNVTINRVGIEVNYKVKVDFRIKYKYRRYPWQSGEDVTVTGEQIFQIGENSKTLIALAPSTIYQLQSFQVIGVTLI